VLTVTDVTIDRGSRIVASKGRAIATTRNRVRAAELFMRNTRQVMTAISS